MYDEFVPRGGDLRAFQKLLENDKVSDALSNIAALNSTADELLDSGVEPEDLWSHVLDSVQAVKFIHTPLKGERNVDQHVRIERDSRAPSKVRQRRLLR